MATEEKQQEQTEEQQETTEEPTLSTPSLVSPEQTSAPPFDVDQFMEKLSGVIDEKVSRTFQSAKDRRFSNLEKMSSYLQAADGDVAKATKEWRNDELYERLVASDEADGSAPQGNESSQKYMEAKTKLRLEQAGIDFEDPRYVMLKEQYAGQITDPVQWNDIVELAVEGWVGKEAKSESISAATAVSEGGTAEVSAPEGDLEELTQELFELQQQRPTSETMAKRREVRKKIGVIHDKTDFTIQVDST